jgi:hypothetical protein
MIQYLFTVAIDKTGMLVFSGEPTEHNVHPKEAELMKLVTDAVNGAVMDFSKAQLNAVFCDDLSADLAKRLKRRQDSIIREQTQPKKRKPDA